MKYILVALFALMPFLASAQALPIVWQRCYGGGSYDNAQSICKPMTGTGYIFAGSTYSEDGDITTTLHGSADCLVMKVDTVGGIVWSRTIGGPSLERAYSIWPTAYGYIFGGFTSSNSIDVAGNHGASDAWLVKLNDTGAVIWQRCYGGTGNESFSSILPTTDGGCLAIGGTSSPDGDVVGYPGAGLQHMWVVKLNDTGGIVWQKTLGGTNGAFGTSALQTTDGGYLVAGYTTSTDGDVTGNHGSLDGWVLRLGADGNIIWKRCYGGSGAESINYLAHAVEGGFILAGQTTSADGDVSHFYGGDINGGDVWVVHIDDTGNVLWEKSYGGSGNERANSVHLTVGNNYVIAGRTESRDGDVTGRLDTTDAWVLLINDTGAILWQKCLGGTQRDMAFDVLPTADTGFVVACATSSANHDVTFNNGLEDCWLVKLGSTTETKTQNVRNQYNWKLFPNPFTGHINLQGNAISGELDITITDVAGRVVYHCTHRTTLAPVSIPITIDCNAGTYFVQISNGNTRETFPILLQK